MRSNTRRACFLIVCVCFSWAIRPGRITAAEPQPLDIDVQELRRFGGQGGIAGVPPGTPVYSNTIDPVEFFYAPGAGERLADDLELAAGACDLVYYQLAVFSPRGTPRFNVRTELWDGDPCLPTSSVIAGTEAEFTGILSGDAVALEVSLETSPVAIPDKVWLAATFSTSDSGWLIAEGAEIGFTDDLFSENDPIDGCDLYWFGGPPNPLAGFWANVNCDITNPPGACCEGVSCTEVTESECLGGTWQGGFTTCDPNPCLPGACCTGFDFTTCNDTTEARCAGAAELFHPGATCAEEPCPPAFKVYENDFHTGFFDAPELGTTWGDDLALGPGPPCELAAYDITMFGDTGSPPYNVQLALWTNNDRGTPLNETDDTPMAPISGTEANFTGIPGNGTAHVVFAGPFKDIILPEKIWMVFSTSSALAGPLLGGMADIGFSLDRFVITTNPSDPSAWVGFWFGGFNPEDCPGGPRCTPAGSFRINVWCAGESPTGACCNDAATTCVDGATEPQCDGRWAVSSTCDSNPFNPPCGTNACCTEHGCADILPTDCDSLFPSAIVSGSFCADTRCPRRECLGASGDCLEDNGTPGCEDAFCCEIVCAGDDPCCTVEWDQVCADEAQTMCPPPPAPNDHCAEAVTITGVGSFDFDNTTATTDGPPHAACSAIGGDRQTTDDVWFCWTAACDGNVSVRTCDQTAVDTKVAVYKGCDTCPPAGADLLTCIDDACATESQQSHVVFSAKTEQHYLIRIGTFPGGGGFPRAEGGAGQFTISCGVPDNPTCPGENDCCTAGDSSGCADEACCEKVCACDPFCCEFEWDEACAGHGVSGSGCGAAVLCTPCRVPGDLDGDGDVDLDDLRIFIEMCFQGPGTTNPAVCIPADFDGNWTGNLKDVAGFQNAFNPP